MIGKATVMSEFKNIWKSKSISIKIKRDSVVILKKYEKEWAARKTPYSELNKGN